MVFVSFRIKQTLPTLCISVIGDKQEK